MTMKIVRLDVKNVKRLRAAQITPQGNVIVVGGKNGQGKSSLLDSIMFAIGGKDSTCREPLRRGAKRAEIVCDLGEIIVKRTFGVDGTRTLIVEGKDGVRMTKPQTRLDDLIGQLSFDPLEFTRMDARRQAETLRALVGLDFAGPDATREKVFDERTGVNREMTALRARLGALPALVDGLPEVEITSADVLAELDGAQAVNAANASARQAAAGLGGEAITAIDAYNAAARNVDDLRTKLAAAEVEAARLSKECDAAKSRAVEADRVAGVLVDVDEVAIRERLSTLEASNRDIRQNAERRTIAKQLQAKVDEAAAMTEQLVDIDTAKREAIAKATFPVPGLGFDDDGQVTFGGLPFEQASGAEQLRASVAIGMALNPKLRVLLVHDGSLLDEDSLRLMSEMADAEDFQLWIERVEEGGATVIIEDGVVQEHADPDAKAAADELAEAERIDRESEAQS